METQLWGRTRYLNAAYPASDQQWDAAVRQAALISRLAALAVLKRRIDTGLAREVWESAPATSWDRPPVWSHGDIASGNLLVQDGRLSVVIDFGTSGVGDPACDLVIAYTFFAEESRSVFRDAVAQDAGTWARARAWALWKALITYDTSDSSHQVITEVLADHRAQG